MTGLIRDLKTESEAGGAILGLGGFDTVTFSTSAAPASRAAAAGCHRDGGGAVAAGACVMCGRAVDTELDGWRRGRGPESAGSAAL